jgi:hypothetical protein
MCSECERSEKEYLKMHFADPYRDVPFYAKGETLEQSFILKREFKYKAEVLNELPVQQTK